VIDRIEKRLKPEMRSAAALLLLRENADESDRVLEGDNDSISSLRQSETLESFEAESYPLKWLNSHLP